MFRMASPTRNESVLVLFVFVFAISGRPAAAIEPRTDFSKPSQAYAFAVEAEQKLNRASPAQDPLLRIRSENGRRLAKTWCPVFAGENQAGEELYYLALLCNAALDWQKTKIAAEQYLDLAMRDQPHTPEAHRLLAVSYRMQFQPDKAWEVLRVALQEDPIQSHLCFMIDSLIEDEQNDARALNWSKERYSIFLKRIGDPNSDATKVSYQWTVLAGTNLVHRYYLSDKNEEAQNVLEQLNRLEEAHSNQVGPWASEELHWANLEMRAAPSIPIRKLISERQVAQIIQKGRVEIISFFFLGCAPCMSELRALNDLQRRHHTSKVLVADVTTYKANSFGQTTESKIEDALNQTRRKKAPEVSMVLTSDEALADYGINGFPVIVVIDKSGRVRYMGRDISFEPDDPVGRLVAKLVTQ